MFINPFFKNKGPFYLNDILQKCNIPVKEKFKKILIKDIKNLPDSKKNDLTFFHLPSLQRLEPSGPVLKNSLQHIPSYPSERKEYSIRYFPVLLHLLYRD